MSQITAHVLDPYNTPVLLEINKDEIISSIAEDLYKVSLTDVFGLGECKEADWSKIIKRYLIIDMFDCTNAVSLDEQQLKCLVGAAFTGLDRQIPCDNNIYS